MSRFRLFQVFMNLRSESPPTVFQGMKVGDVVEFTYRADPNFHHLGGGTVRLACTAKFPWTHSAHAKYNFLPVKFDKDVGWKYDKHTDLKIVIPIANVLTGEVYSCEVNDRGYVQLELRNPAYAEYYHAGSFPVYVPISFLRVDGTDNVAKIRSDFAEDH